jgi:glutathione S-transferase
MMELHQFRHSAFCLKVRMVLQAKGLSYRTVDVTPGMGQVAVFRMSGQRQVPVLVDGDVVVADSSAIARHLEQREPSPALIPADLREAAQVQIIEDWADTTLAAAGRSALVQAAAMDPSLRVALLPDDLPDPVRTVMGAIPGGWVGSVTELVNQNDRADLLTSLEQLSASVQQSPWLVGRCHVDGRLVCSRSTLVVELSILCGCCFGGKRCSWLERSPKIAGPFPMARPTRAQVDGADAGRGVNRSW